MSNSNKSAPKSIGLEKIKSPEEYLSAFDGVNIDGDEKITKAYEKAWDARKFEIDNYWKRTTYFWAFQVTAFAAYIAILNSDAYKATPPKNPSLLYCIISFGYITALAWSLINIVVNSGSGIGKSILICWKIKLLVLFTKQFMHIKQPKHFQFLKSILL